MPLARRFCEMQVLIASLFFEIRSNGLFDSANQPRLVLDTYRRMVQTQARIASDLGLSPLARRQLSLTAQSDDLAAAMAKRAQRSEDEESRAEN